MKQTILVVDDDPAMVEVLDELLSREGYRVDSRPEGESAIAAVSNSGYDLILLDVGLPGCNGFEVCRRLRDRGIHTPIVMLTGLVEITNKITGLRLGADDYISKPFDAGEFLARIGALLRRAGQKSRAGEDRVRFGDVLVDFSGGSAVRDGKPVSLSAKELRLLRYLVARRGEVVARDELLREVWGYESSLTRTVDVHVATLRQKLEEHPDRPRYIVTVRRRGYVFRSDPPGQ
jgi:DNA-binding response OmpR family regulator